MQKEKDDDTCRGIFADASGKCLPKVPSDAFYTTWSLYLLIVSSLLTVIYVSITRSFGIARGNKWVDLVFLPLALAGVANSLAVPLAVEYFFAFGLTTREIRPTPEANNLRNVQRQFLQPSFLVHTAPIYVSVICIFALFTAFPSEWTVKRWYIVAAISAVMIGAFQFAYLTVPYERERYLNKVRRVYRKADAGSASLLIVSILLIIFSFSFSFGRLCS